MDWLAETTTLTCLNGVEGLGPLFQGRQAEVDLRGKDVGGKEAAVAVSRLLRRSEATITRLELRCGSVAASNARCLRVRVAASLRFLQFRAFKLHPLQLRRRRHHHTTTSTTHHSLSIPADSSVPLSLASSLPTYLCPSFSPAPLQLSGSLVIRHQSSLSIIL